MLEWAYSCVPLPPASGDPHSTDSRCIYRQGGRGTGTLRYPVGRRGGEGGDMYRERFASTPHTPSFYKAAFWVFVLFVYAKTIILNKYRL